MCSTLSQRISGARCRAMTAALLALALNTACGSPTSPSDPYAGTWSGGMDDRALGSLNLQMTLSDTPNLAGSWRVAVSGASLSGSASLLPLEQGSPRQLGLTCGPPPSGGAILLSPTLTGGTLEGTYTAFGCGSLTRGTVRLTRQ